VRKWIQATIQQRAELRAALRCTAPHWGCAYGGRAGEYTQYEVTSVSTHTWPSTKNDWWKKTYANCATHSKRTPTSRKRLEKKECTREVGTGLILCLHHGETNTLHMQSPQTRARCSVVFSKCVVIRWRYDKSNFRQQHRSANVVNTFTDSCTQNYKKPRKHFIFLYRLHRKLHFKPYISILYKHDHLFIVEDIVSCCSFEERTTLEMGN
jgi:hypothetical protein